MFWNDIPSLTRLHNERLQREARESRLLRVALGARPPLGYRLLPRLGDALISAGQKLKGEQPCSEPSLRPLPLG